MRRDEDRVRGGVESEREYIEANLNCPSIRWLIKRGKLSFGSNFFLQEKDFII